MQDSGTIFYIDAYNTQYHVSWTTTGSSLDITTVVKQPYVWGKAVSGRVQNKVVYRNGLITTTRQMIRIDPEGYTIIADGHESVEAEFQTTFPCGPKPSDPFKHHFNNGVSDEVEIAVTDGPRWTDPDSASNPITWASGFEWVNIWSN